MNARRLLLLIVLLGASSCGDGAEPAVDLAGTWLLDREAFTRSLLTERLEALAPEARATLAAEKRSAWLAAARASARDADLRVDLLADGAFVVRYRFGSEQGARRGTWRQSGREVVLRTTHTASGKMAEPSEIAGRLEEGLLSFSQSETVPHAFTLRRR